MGGLEREVFEEVGIQQTSGVIENLKKKKLKV